MKILLLSEVYNILCSRSLQSVLLMQIIYLFLYFSVGPNLIFVISYARLLHKPFPGVRDLCGVDLELVSAISIYYIHALITRASLVENHDEKRGLFPMFKSGFLTGSADKVSRRRDDLKRPSCNPDMVHTVIVQTSI